MATKRKEEEERLARTEPGKLAAPFEEVEKWFEDVLSRPFSIFAPAWWPKTRLAEMVSVTPSVDIFREGNEIVVKAETPGMKKEDLDISITDDTVTISGEKKKQERVEKKDYFRYERSEGSFSRSFHLPEGVLTDKATAKFKDGVLEIRLPVAEEARKKRKKVNIS